MIYCFARIDLFSAYWEGSRSDQTRRMVDFMTNYMQFEKEACWVAVQMWRHQLMHTGEPRYLRDESRGITYTWLLQWWEHLPADQHFRLDSGKIDIGLVYLIRNLKTALGKFLHDISGDLQLQMNLEKIEKEIGTIRRSR